jgi:1,2-diacylglycerol 3-alpha-glucosyltransferase
MKGAGALMAKPGHSFQAGPERDLGHAHGEQETADGEPAPVWPLQQISAALGRPWRIALLSDFINVPYANGAVFQTRLLYQELLRRGHEVTIVGPDDPAASDAEVAPGTLRLPSAPLRTYPGLRVPLPPAWMFGWRRFRFDICLAQTTSLLLQFGLWMREMFAVPLLCVNTTHLTAAYDVLLPESLSRSKLVHWLLQSTLKRPMEDLYASMYNRSDGLIVLSDGLREYWRDRGVSVPIHVIARAVAPQIFDAPGGPDPYQRQPGRWGATERGLRIVCAGRHVREKAQDRVIRIFARHIAPHEPQATLTLVGHGPDTAFYQQLAEGLGVGRRVFFTGEVPFTQMPDWYSHADVFLHASLSETYGNVITEALWCGTPLVAFADGMGVSAQVQHGVNGLLVEPGTSPAEQEEADAQLGAATLALLRDPAQRERLGDNASRIGRGRNSPRAVQQRLADAYLSARRHLEQSGLQPAMLGSGPGRLWQTLRNTRPWALYHSALLLAGCLRPAPGAAGGRKQPLIWR